jgi:hypothetical protein
MSNLEFEGIVLSRDGFFKQTWVYDKKTEQGSYDRKRLEPNMFDLLEAWNSRFEIEDGITLRDLIKMLRSYDELELTIIEVLTNCNIKPHLKEWDDEDAKGDDDENPLVAIEVGKFFDIDGWDADTPHPACDCHTSCSGIVAKSFIDSDGTDSGCKNCAIEFVPWSELMRLPLRLNKVGGLYETEWTDCEPHSLFAKDDLNRYMSKRKIVKCSNRNVMVTFTLGEFMGALFTELCFFGSPEARDAERSHLNGIVDELHKNIDAKKKLN